MNFASDNTAGASDQVMKALVEANGGRFSAYGADPITERVTARLKEIFECDLVAYPVATGSAANSIALACLSPRYGAIYCHREAHVEMDECGAPEFYTGGAKLTVVDGPAGRIDPAKLASSIHGAGFVHSSQPAAVTITNLTECGGAYRVEEVEAISQVAKQHKLALHMDGARFANALAHRNVSPADITWRAGVDALSFGATKNGALAAEVVVFFGEAQAKAQEFEFLRKRGGHLFSKMRFLSAQLDAYLAEDHWMDNARHANAMAADLAQSIEASADAKLLYPVEGNELFVALPVVQVEALRAQGFEFYDWAADVSSYADAAGASAENWQAIRLITAFNSSSEDVAKLGQAITALK